MLELKQKITDELVINPSRITEHILGIVLKLNNKYEIAFKSKNIFKKFQIDFKIKMYLKVDYLEYYNFLKNYKAPNIKDQRDIKKLTLLFEEFERMFEGLNFNNFALIYVYTIKKKISNPIFTMEDKKIFFLKKLYHNEITPSAFIKEFGHYALNAYELSSKRFEEYSHNDLLRIARLVSNFDFNKKIELEEYIRTKPREIIPILIALRELAKYHILFIVKDIRYVLLGIAKKRGTQNIFNISYDEIIKL